MTKKYILLILLVSICCCSRMDKNDELSKYNSVLGSKNAETLDILLNKFENDYLAINYPNLNLESAYKNFLEDIVKGKVEKLPQKSIEIFENSTLKFEIYKFPDSVWVIENSSYDQIDSDSVVLPKTNQPYIKIRYKTELSNGEFKYSYSRKSIISLKTKEDLESILKRELRSRVFNFSGKYYEALQILEHKSPFYKEFLDKKNSAGTFFPELLANAMLYKKIDLNDPINRRLILIELVY